MLVVILLVVELLSTADAGVADIAAVEHSSVPADAVLVPGFVVALVAVEEPFRVCRHQPPLGRGTQAVRVA